MRRLTNRSWTKVIRGKSQFESFKAAMQTNGAYYALTPNLNDSKVGIDAAIEVAFGSIPLFSDGNFPGLVVSSTILK